MNRFSFREVGDACKETDIAHVRGLCYGLLMRDSQGAFADRIVHSIYITVCRQCSGALDVFDIAHVWGRTTLMCLNERIDEFEDIGEGWPILLGHCRNQELFPGT